MEEEPTAPVFVLVAEEAQPLTTHGATVTSICRSDRTGGAWSLVKYTAPPHYNGPPLHRHDATMEALYILDGTLAFTLDERTITASTGAFILVPPGIVHTFFNPTASPASYLVWFSPGGHEQYFAEVARLSDMQPPASDAEALMAALDQQFDQHVMPSV